MRSMQYSIVMATLVLTTSCQNGSAGQIQKSDLVGSWSCVFADDGETQNFTFNQDGTYTAERKTELQGPLWTTREPVDFTQYGNWDVSSKEFTLSIEDIDADYTSETMATLPADSQDLMNEVIGNLASVRAVGATLSFDVRNLSLEETDTLHWGARDLADRMTCDRRESTAP